MKYCRTVSPSLKLAVIGVSIISPEGFAIRPLIPASCLICCELPLAPESAIIYIELKSVPFSTFPSIILLSSDSRSLNISSETCSFTCAQISIILLYLSPFVISPFLYCFSTFMTSFLPSSITFSFVAGMRISSRDMDIPALVEYMNPISFSLSINSTVFSLPAFK